MGLFSKAKDVTRNAKENVVRGAKKRKNFVSLVWGMFLNYARHFKNIEIEKREIPFREAIARWGFGVDEAGIRRGRTANAMMAIIFYTIMIWCIFYITRAFVIGHFTAIIASVMGACTGFIVGTVSLWRWSVFKNRKYISILKWLRKGSLTFALMFCICISGFSGFSANEAFAAESVNPNEQVQIKLPSGVQIQKPSDVTAAMFSRLFGESWHTVAGGTSNVGNGGLGLFSGLIVSVLGILNVAAMTFVSAAIIYMWGIFAVNTAHQGKQLGGSVYNSLWVPVRHAFSFSLTVPVLNGLSLLQVAILAMVSLSINFANVVWDSSGKYISEHAHTGIIDSSAPMLETEAYQMMPLMFEGSVFQELAKYAETQHQGSAGNIWAEFQEQPGVVEGGGRQTFSSLEKSISRKLVPGTDGLLVEEIDRSAGKRTLYLRPTKGLEIGDMGGVVIPYPRWVTRNEGGGRSSRGYYVFNPPPADNTANEPMMAISDARTQAVIKLWQDMRLQAQAYLGTTDSTKSDKPAIKDYIGKKAPSYLDSLNEYKSSITQAIGKSVQTYVEKDGVFKQRLENAIDSSGGESKYGWASAGMFTFTLASIQQKIDDEVMQHTSLVYPDRRAKDRDDGWFSFTQKVYDKLGLLKPTLERASTYFATKVVGNSRYAAGEVAGPDKGKFEEIGVVIMKNLLTSNTSSNTRDRTGVLSAVLEEFGKYDPIVVMQSFGNRLLSAAQDLLLVGVLSTLSGVGLIGGMTVIAVFVAGATFAYVVPITPFIFWMQALVSWIFMVIETMVAAPFWACVHALPEGTGFAGERARQGYMMLIDILIRPVLLVLGAVFAVAMMQAVGWLFSTLMNGWFANIGVFIGRSFVADIVFSIVVMSVMYYASLTIFTKGVNYMPQHVSRWMGGTTAGSGLGAEGDMDASTRVVGGVINQGGGAAGALGGGLKNAGGKMYGAAKGALSSAEGKTGEVGKGDSPAPMAEKQPDTDPNPQA